MLGELVGDDSVVVPGTAPLLPRLFLTDRRWANRVLQGGWWPRSWDPVAELPGLIIVLCARYGPISGLDLAGDTWTGSLARLAVADGVVHIRRCADADPTALGVVRAHHDVRLELLVVAPETAAASATRSMRTAADPTNTMTGPPQ